MVTKTEIKAKLAKRTGRSVWEKGVIKYAKEMVDDLEPRVEYSKSNLHKALLNGARDWKQYSNGFTLVYNEDIAKRLCSPTELKKVENGKKRPNSRETWIDVQTRALHQAERLIMGLI